MADQANVYVKNFLDVNLEIKRLQPNNEEELLYTLSKGEKEMVFLASSDVRLLVIAKGEINNHIPLGFKTTGGVLMSFSPSSNTWTITPELTNENPDTPTTVNVNVGDEDV